MSLQKDTTFFSLNLLEPEHTHLFKKYHLYNTLFKEIKSQKTSGLNVLFAFVFHFFLLFFTSFSFQMAF